MLEILLIVLVIWLIFGGPWTPYYSQYGRRGYGGGIGIIVIILILLLLFRGPYW